MRAALAARDIAGVFRLLQRVGVSQRRIAALTGQSQSEISEILAGAARSSRTTCSPASPTGSACRAGSLGLAYDDATAALVGVAPGGRTRRAAGGLAPADGPADRADRRRAAVDPQTWRSRSRCLGAGARPCRTRPTWPGWRR